MEFRSPKWITYFILTFEAKQIKTKPFLRENYHDCFLQENRNSSTHVISTLKTVLKQSFLFVRLHQFGDLIQTFIQQQFVFTWVRIEKIRRQEGERKMEFTGVVFGHRTDTEIWLFSTKGTTCRSQEETSTSALSLWRRKWVLGSRLHLPEEHVCFSGAQYSCPFC